MRRNSAVVIIGTSKRAVSGTSENSGLDGCRSGKDPFILHAPKFGSQQRFPGGEMPQQRGVCLLVLIGRLNHDVAQRTAVGAFLQGSTLNQGVEAGHARRVQPRLVAGAVIFVVSDALDWYRHSTLIHNRQRRIG
jgi:hypothetical protein